MKLLASGERFIFFTEGDPVASTTACIRNAGPSFPHPGKNFSHLTAEATIYDTSGSHFGKSVVKFIFFLRVS